MSMIATTGPSVLLSFVSSRDDPSARNYPESSSNDALSDLETASVVVGHSFVRACAADDGTPRDGFPTPMGACPSRSVDPCRSIDSIDRLNPSYRSDPIDACSLGSIDP